MQAISGKGHGSSLPYHWLVVVAVINQSIKESNFYRANIPGVARLNGATAKSVFKSKVDEAISQHQRAIESAGVHGEKA